MFSFIEHALVLASCALLASAGPYEEYILAPSSRTLVPRSVYNVNGTVTNPEALTSAANGTASFGPASAVTYDYGLNIAGVVSFSVGEVSGSDEFIGISFSESSLWINAEGCDATSDSGIDQALWFSVTSGGSYTVEPKYQRGGFKYLNVYHNTSGNVVVDTLSVNYTAVPHLSEAAMRDYTGYFHSNDDSVNRVWYAGAYTNQMCTIDPVYGDSLIYIGVVKSDSNITTPLDWWSNTTIANGTSVLVDGAKRDKLVWPGDIAISGPSVFVSTNDMISIKNSLDSLLVLQNSSGALPYAGYPFNEAVPVWSFTYHLYSLIDIYDYYLYTGELDYLQANWARFKLGLNYPLQFVDSTGLAYVPTSADWLRFGMGAHNIEANSILYYTLNLGVTLTQLLNDTSNSSTVWTNYATKIKTAANELLWDPETNLYRDNDSLPLTDLHPQDGNCWAILANITDSTEKAANISDALYTRWTPYGPPAPEADATVSPFISGFEIQAHYLAGNPSRAIELVKSMWADFMLDDPRMTNSTFIEGYSTNGDLHYAPYANDPRISHAHGWATGPTSTLTFFAAGLRVTSAAGKTWSISPNLGGLTNAAAGFQTPLGSYSINVTTIANSTDLSIEFEAPAGTTGTVSLPGPETEGKQVQFSLRSVDDAFGSSPSRHVVKRDVVGTGKVGERITVDGVQGGKYSVTLKAK